MPREDPTRRYLDMLGRVLGGTVDNLRLQVEETHRRRERNRNAITAEFRVIDPEPQQLAMTIELPPEIPGPVTPPPPVQGNRERQDMEGGRA